MTFTFPSLYTYQTRNGVVVPNTSVIKTNVTNMMYTIFGQDLDTTEETPVGRLIEAITMMMVTTLGINAQNANQLNYNISAGIYLDSIASLYGITRRPATSTVVQISVTGTAGTVIPSGTLLATDAGDVYYVQDAITIGSDGTATGYAASQETGPIPCEWGTLTNIKESVTGFTSVTNDTQSPQYGQEIETDDALRNRIAASRGTATSTTESITNAIWAAVPTLKGVWVAENGTANQINVREVAIGPHSIFVAVANCTEATKLAVATAIYNSKTAGAAYEDDMTYSGQTKYVVSVTDPNTSQSYNVTFYGAVPLSIKFSLEIEDNKYTGSDLSADVNTAISNYLSDLGIGGTITKNGVENAVEAAISDINVNSVTLMVDTETYSRIDLHGYQYGSINTITITDADGN